jgi:hypothetical protein
MRRKTVFVGLELLPRFKRVAFRLLPGRTKVWISVGLCLLFLASSAFTLGVLIKHEPTFYKEASKPAGMERTAQSAEFESRCGSLINGIQNRYPDWWEVFTTDQINAFLQEGFLTSWGGNNNLPDGFHDLRVQIEDGMLRLGCRYGKGFWSTTITIDLKIWLVAKEVNLIGVELVSLRAGGLPVSRQIVLDYITEAGHRKNIDVKWYHRKSNPVAIMKLQADQVRPTIQIQRLDLQLGKMIIVGRSTDVHVGQTTSRSAPR